MFNPVDRKGLMMDFDRLLHPLFGQVVRGFKLWYTFLVIGRFLQFDNSENEFNMKARLKVETK